MKAEQANIIATQAAAEIAEKTNKEVLPEIYQKVTAAAKQGKHSLNWSGAYNELIERELVLNGYKIKRHYADVREMFDYDYITINW